MNFSSLLSIGELLYLFRPCIEENEAEPAIFGTTVCPTSTTFDSIVEIYRRVDHIDVSHSTHHFLYGSSSAILKVRRSNNVTPKMRNTDDLYPFHLSSHVAQKDLSLRKRINMIGTFRGFDGISESQSRSRSGQSFLVMPAAVHGKLLYAVDSHT